MLKWMIAEGYGDVRTITRRIYEMEKWLANPELLEADADAEYAEIIEIDLDQIKEPILCCPNDPDDAQQLSEILAEGEVKIDEVFIGSCMTNIGHFRAAAKLFQEMGEPVPTRTWIVPPTKMDEAQLIAEGHYATFGRSGARTEMPGCSLCMGNQARVAANSTVVSTSTRNFPNRLGDGANVYLASAELSAVAAVLGRLPTVTEYLEITKNIDTVADDIYKYLNFNELPHYQKIADEVVLEGAA
jgi:aconitate hydratase 2/2-methylisocitrate dehydratase